MPYEFRPNARFKPLVDAAVRRAIVDTFEQDILPEAKRLSPVTPAGLARNLEQGKKGVLAKGTGTNRRSIDAEFEKVERGWVARMFTQSGYGGYLEVGTSKMRAQPYLYPAFRRLISKVYPRALALIGKRGR